MLSGKELWDAADVFRTNGSARSARALSFFALGQMLAEADDAAFFARDTKAVEHLRELQGWDASPSSVAQRKEALQRRAAGETLSDIARTYNVSFATISRLQPKAR